MVGGGVTKRLLCVRSGRLIIPTVMAACRLIMVVFCCSRFVLIIMSKLCNQRQFFSHDVELNNKGILHLHHYIRMKINLNAGRYKYWSRGVESFDMFKQNYALERMMIRNTAKVRGEVKPIGHHWSGLLSLYVGGRGLQFVSFYELPLTSPRHRSTISLSYAVVSAHSNMR